MKVRTGTVFVTGDGLASSLLRSSLGLTSRPPLRPQT